MTVIAVFTASNNDLTSSPVYSTVQIRDWSARLYMHIIVTASNTAV